MIDINKVIKELPLGFGNTVSLYGLTYLIIESKKEFGSLENLVIDKLLSAFKSVPDQKQTSTSLFYVSDNNSDNSYFFSHYYNFAINLLTYSAFKRFIKRSNYKKEEITKRLKDIEYFLNYEQQYLINDEEKTIGFELITNKFINDVETFQNKKFVNHYKQYASKRLKKFSPIIAFTPEGLKGFRNSIQLSLFLKKIISKTFLNRVFLFNSPELTIKYINKLDQEHKQLLYNFIKVNQGLPPKFSAEYFDLFWSIDIMNSAGLIDEPIKNAFIKSVESSEAISNAIGSYDSRKGFSIAKGFPLYDSDTTAMALKSFTYLNILPEVVNNYKYDYYYNNATNLYSTYKNDNRPSISVLTHILNSQILTNTVNTQLLKWLDTEVMQNDLIDKFHFSKLYTLYCLAICYTDLYKVQKTGLKQLNHIVNTIISFRKEDNSFTAITNNPEGTLEETAWATLALYYVSTNMPEVSINKDLLKTSQKYLVKNFKDVMSLEKLWIIKQPYNPFRITEVLLFAAMNISIK